MRDSASNETSPEPANSTSLSTFPKPAAFLLASILVVLAIGLAIYGRMNWPQDNEQQVEQKDEPESKSEEKERIDYEAIFTSNDSETMTAALETLAENPPQDAESKLALGKLLFPLIRNPGLLEKVLPVLEQIATLEQADEICKIIEEFPRQNSGLVKWLVGTKSKKHLMSLLCLRGSDNRQSIHKALAEFQIKSKEIARQCIKDIRTSDRDSEKCSIAFAILMSVDIEYDEFANEEDEDDLIAYDKELKKEMIKVFLEIKTEIDSADVYFLKRLVNVENTDMFMRPDLLEKNRDLCQLVASFKTDQVRKFMVRHHFQGTIPHFHDAIMGSPECEKFIWRYLEDSNQGTQVHAIEILKEIGSVDSIPKLKAVKASVIVQQQLEQAITEINERNPNDIVQKQAQ